MELLTVNELADRFRVRPETIKVWVKQGRIPVIRVTGKTLRFDAQAVTTALRDQQPGKAVQHAG